MAERRRPRFRFLEADMFGLVAVAGLIFILSVAVIVGLMCAAFFIRATEKDPLER